MSYSGNEIAALARKAARGAGFDWGTAEEAGRAARWLAARGLPGPEALAGLLERLGEARGPECEGHDWNAGTGALCPLRTGIAISDRPAIVGEGDLRLGPVIYPVLLLPFLADVAQDVGRVHLLAGPGGALIEPDRLWTIGAFPDQTESARIIRAGPHPEDLSEHPPQRPGAIDPGALDTLNAFAERTYAPATDASRAGAGEA